MSQNQLKRKRSIGGVNNFVKKLMSQVPELIAGEKEIPDSIYYAKRIKKSLLPTENI